MFGLLEEPADSIFRETDLVQVGDGGIRMWQVCGSCRSTWGYLIGPGLLHEGILLGLVYYMRVSYWAWSITWGYLIGPDLLHEGILLGLICYMRVSYWAWSVTWGYLIGPGLLHEGILLGLVCYMRVSYWAWSVTWGYLIGPGLLHEGILFATTLVFRYGNTRWVGSHALCEFWLNGCLYAWVWQFRWEVKLCCWRLECM